MDSTFINFNFLPLWGVFVLFVISACWLAVSFYYYKRKPKVIFIQLVIVSFVNIYFVYCHLIDIAFNIEIHKNDSIHDVINQSKWPFLVSHISVESEDYIELEIFPGVIQSMMRVVAFRSGMPAYVFDMHGNLVDHSIDIYDDPPFQKKWEAPLMRREISIDEAKKMISQDRRQSDR